MKELLDKLSSYHLFNYLVPGVVFSLVAQRVTQHSFSHSNLVISFFLYYFIGLVLSRIGSLMIEPFLRLIHFIRLGSYADFVRASMKDEKLELISEVNNMYRTLSAAFVLCAATLAITNVQVTFRRHPSYPPRLEH